MPSRYVYLDVAQLPADKPYLQAKYPLLQTWVRGVSCQAYPYSINLFPWAMSAFAPRGWPLHFQENHHAQQLVTSRRLLSKAVEKNRKALLQRDDQPTITLGTRQGRLVAAPAQRRAASGQESAASSIPVRLLFNELELNFRAAYTLFDRHRGGRFASAMARPASGSPRTAQSLPCPSPVMLCRPPKRLQARLPAERGHWRR